MQIIPSILTNSTDELMSMLARCEGMCDRVQIDVVDGVFAGNRTIDPSALKYLDTDLKLDFHLMVANPASWVEKCASVGANMVIGQIEQMASQEEFIKKCQMANVSVGLAVNLPTPTDSLDQTVIGDIDTLLLMSVPAGFGGQEFDQSVYQKIKDASFLREKDTTPFMLCVDGGVSEASVGTLFRMKVDEVVIGKRLFVGDLKANIDVILNKSKL